MTTRRRRAAAWAASLGLMSALGASSREPLLYVTNEIPNTISVVSPRTNAVVATIPVGKRPRGMALSPDKRTVYVALGQDDVHRSEEHTSELQSRGHLVCRLLLEKKKR